MSHPEEKRPRFPVAEASEPHVPERGPMAVAGGEPQLRPAEIRKGAHTPGLPLFYFLFYFFFSQHLFLLNQQEDQFWVLHSRKSYIRAAAPFRSAALGAAGPRSERGEEPAAGTGFLETSSLVLARCKAPTAKGTGNREEMQRAECCSFFWCLCGWRVSLNALGSAIPARLLSFLKSRAEISLCLPPQEARPWRCPGRSRLTPVFT